MDFGDLLKAHGAGSEATREKRPQKRRKLCARPAALTSPSDRPRALVVVCAGGSSLHETLFEGVEDWKNVDLKIVQYDSKAEFPSEDDRFKSYEVILKTGSKWELIRGAISPPFGSKYDLIWLPDDDLQFTGPETVELLAFCFKNDFQLAQPSLTSDSHFSNFKYESLLKNNDSVKATITNFVEIMCPLFSGEALDSVWESTIGHCDAKSGWGMDTAWSRKLNVVGVVHTVAIRHTRPMNAFSGGFYASQKIDPRLEEHDLFERLKLKPLRKFTVKETLT